MAWQLRIRPKAKIDLAKIPLSHLSWVLAVLPVLAVDPFIGKKLKIKGIGTSCLYAYHIWSYHIIYGLIKNKSAIIVIRIGQSK